MRTNLILRYQTTGQFDLIDNHYRTLEATGGFWLRQAILLNAHSKSFTSCAIAAVGEP